MFQCKKESLKMDIRAPGIRRIEKSLKTGKILSPDMEKKRYSLELSLRELKIKRLAAF